MWAYGLGVTLFFRFSQEFIIANKQIIEEVAFWDKFTVTGKVDKIKLYRDMLQQVGLLYGYFPKPSGSYLIVKEVLLTKRPSRKV